MMIRYLSVLVCILVSGAVHWRLVAASRAVLIAPATSTLVDFPRQLGDWITIADIPLTPEVQQVIGADQSLSRRYLHVPTGQSAEVFLGYFASSASSVLSDRDPHLPTVCLPAAGWTIMRQFETPESMHLKITSGREQRHVQFWHQTPQRSVANPLLLRWYGPFERWETGRNDFVLARIIQPQLEASLAPALRAAASTWFHKSPSTGKEQ